MNENALLSIVTPVYNGERFVQSAYECLYRQTYRNWEWVVVDDGSTDHTVARMHQLQEQDSRIRFFQQPNSGSAKQPRDHAVYESKGSFIIPFDIDDLLSDDYLELMLYRQQETGADIVYPKMIFTDLNTGKTTRTLPVAGFDTKKIYVSRDLVRETAPEWNIGCNGGIYKREVWINMSYPERKEPIWMNSDEVDERLYLLHAQTAAFAEAHYYYRNHEQSISTKVTPKLFHTQKTCLQLLDITEEAFGKSSEEYRKMHRKAFYDWRCKMKLFITHYDQLAYAQGELHHSLQTCFQRLDPRLLTTRERLQFINLCHFGLLFALFCLKYNPKLLVQKIIQRCCPEAYITKIAKPRSEQTMYQQMADSYTQGQSLLHYEPYAISIFCGNVASGGLVDRLRGAVSTYMACQTCGRKFKLHFTYPFKLSDYLMPSEYDWQIAPDDVAFNKSQSTIIVSNTLLDSPKERLEQKLYLQTELQKNKDKQVHVYTNAAFCYNHDFAHVFRQLFKPAPRLQEHLDAIRSQIGSPYMTVSARFCNKLDDFNEEVYCEPLMSQERDQLISNCLRQLKKLIGNHPSLRLVICSDSIRFVKEAQRHFDVFTIPGTISHIGNDDIHDYNYYEKTFLDFFTISQAERVFLLKGPYMMQSGFPYAAALAGGVPFEVIHF